MDQILSVAIILVFVGVVLVLGSVVTVPYTQGEDVGIETTIVWADDVFAIGAHDVKKFDLDIGGANHSIISTHVETTGDLTFKILGTKPRPLFEFIIENSSVAGSKDFFWTYPQGYFARLFFENQNPVEVEALITVKSYFPRASRFIEVTRYDHLLDPAFSYLGVIAVIAGIMLNYAYTSAKRKTKGINGLELWASIALSLVGVALVLGSVVTIPYTQNERFEVEETKVWTDDAFTLEPNATKRFMVDNTRVNSSIINIHIDETTDLVYLEIVEGELALHTVFEWGWENTTRVVPDELFWTYPRQVDVWYFVFRNPNPVDINVSVKIKEYFPRAYEWREVTRYNHLLDPVFTYPGIATIIIGAALKQVKTKTRKSQQPPSS